MRPALSAHYPFKKVKVRVMILIVAISAQALLQSRKISGCSCTEFRYFSWRRLKVRDLCQLLQYLIYFGKSVVVVGYNLCHFCTGQIWKQNEIFDSQSILSHLLS